MSETDKVFAGSVPENYDRYMVPLIFEPYAVDMAGRAAALSPHAVLEIAAGSGVVTRASLRWPIVREHPFAMKLRPGTPEN